MTKCKLCDYQYCCNPYTNVPPDHIVKHVSQCHKDFNKQVVELIKQYVVDDPHS